MRKSIILLIGLLTSFSAMAQLDEKAAVSIQPDIQVEYDMPHLSNVLYNKLSQIVTMSGLGGRSVGSPFIITANPVMLNSETLNTAPAKTAVELMVNFYVGNGMEGTLFSSCGISVKGVGDDLEKAYLSAVKKISPNNRDLQKMLGIARTRIVDYYQSHGAEIMAQAKALAGKKQYDEAYMMLASIPSVCSEYEQAQKLISTYAAEETESANNSILTRAKAAWAASPNQDGASEASSILSEIKYPSAKISERVNALTSEMSTRLKKVEDTQRAHEHAAEMAQINADRQAQKDAHNERMAQINANERVARAYASRPVHYHYHWW